MQISYEETQGWKNEKEKSISTFFVKLPLNILSLFLHV